VNFRSAFLLTILISILASCTKIESTDIGAGLIPPVDNISTFDSSFPVITRNFFDTGYVYPLRTDNLVLGRISNDPSFGKTTGIINLELRPEYHPFRFRGIYDSLKLDSVVLVLSYRGVWGDTANANPAVRSQTLRVYEIDPAGAKQLTSDSIYSTRTAFQHKPTILGSVTFDPARQNVDTLRPYGETINKDQIRIKLTDPLITQKLFKDTTLLDSAKGFKAKFAGFAIVPDTTGTSNNLLVVNLTDSNTKVAFYYRGRLSGATKSDTAATYYRFTAPAGYSNHIIRNPVTATGAEAEFVSTLTTTPDNLVYLETRPDAPYTRIKIPGLDSLKNCIIHRAELILEQVRTSPTPGSMDDYFSPPALFLSAYSSDSSRRFMLPSSDVQFSQSGVSNLADFGAFPNRRYNSAEGYVTFYSFSLTRYVQGVATNKNRNYELVLWAPFADYIHAVENFNAIVPLAGSSILNPLALGRLRVGGGSHSQHRMRLRIIYTRI
jgi:hypothetical protein